MIDVLIIGAGPAGLYAADQLSSRGYSVQVVERKRSPARKFLLAGRGGLNLTHSEPLGDFTHRYREASGFMAPLLERFPPDALRAWCHALGQDTFIGSSGRIFPKAMKASPLVRALLNRLSVQNVTMRFGVSWEGFDENGRSLLRETADTVTPATVAPTTVTPTQARSVLLALGGASWPHLGADGSWQQALRQHGVQVQRFEPANCGFLIPWSDHLVSKCAGAPLKRVRLSVGPHSSLGEAMISASGLEGGVVYALSAEIRNAINQSGHADLTLDLRPDLDRARLSSRLGAQREKQSISTVLRKAAGLSGPAQSVLREAGPLPREAEALATLIKSVPLTATAPYAIDRAISSAGGIALDEVDRHMMLTRMPGVFVAGEMLDWEAPTGGYLLQGCFATAHAASAGIQDYLAETNIRENAG
ncbi:NAD(FAD)-utilizing dehydrogenase [Roseibium aquae]|uniref:NAD(FAD)-utilizing dehydrogenase n=1 Tax=Roseibium aquae TaxID=1323746 RepID=A0A916TL20_9HYPH|nr:TIGR03862 family flavoprotein [Roseibium aquae]GGB53253.1 NAD(FAD)-utilizing dehydrogenase [Roseibium aquae]